MKKTLALLTTTITPLFCMEKDIKQEIQNEIQKNKVPFQQKFAAQLQSQKPWPWSDFINEYDRVTIYQYLITHKGTSQVDKNGDTFLLANTRSCYYDEMMMSKKGYAQAQKDGFDLGAQSGDGKTILMLMIEYYKKRYCVTENFYDTFYGLIELLQGNIHQKDFKKKTALIYAIEYDSPKFFTKLLNSVCAANNLAQLEPDALECAMIHKRIPMIEALVIRDYNIPPSFPTSIVNSQDMTIQTMAKCLTALKKYQSGYDGTDTSATTLAQDTDIQAFLTTIVTYAAVHDHTKMIEAVTLQDKYQQVIDACLNYNCQGALHHALDNLHDEIDSNERAAEGCPCFYASKYIAGCSCNTIDRHGTVGIALGYICGSFWPTVLCPCWFPIAIVQLCLDGTCRDKLEIAKFWRGRDIRRKAKENNAFVFLEAFKNYFKQKKQFSTGTVSEEYHELDDTNINV